MNAKTLTALALSGLLLMSGCSASTKTVDGKSVVASTSLGNIFADSVYTSLLDSSNGENALFSYVLDTLIDQKYPVTSDMEENADNMISSIESSYQSQYGDDDYEEQLESDLESAGYDSIDDYREKVVYSLQYAEMMKDYVKDNYDEVFDDYYKMATPRYISLIKVSVSDTSNPTDDEKAALKEVKALLKEGKDFGDVAKNYSDDEDTASAKGSLGIVDTTSSLSDTYGSEVQSEALSLKSGETSDTITGTDGWYILHCDSTKKSTIKEELENVDIESPLITYDDYMVYVAFNTYTIKYHDKTIKKMMTEFLDEMIEEREEEREDD